MSLRFRLASAAVGAAVAAVAACSLIVETRGAQCKTDADCAGFANAACDPTTSACVDKDELACRTGDCVCNPTTSQDILNGCPKGPCVPFDNARVPGLTDGGLPVPDDTGAVPDATYSCGNGGSGTGGASPTLPPCNKGMAANDLLYLYGPDSIKPLVAWVAKLFAQDGTRVIFQANSSCTAVATLYEQSLFMMDGVTEFATWYYQANGEDVRCYIPDKGVKPDIALSDVYPQRCGYNLAGTDQSVVDSPGPVQAMGFVVPKHPKSMQKSISAEAAFMIYGFGAEAAGVEPWTDQRYVFQRSKSSGTQQMIATTLGLDPKAMHGTGNHGSSDEAALLGCSPAPEKSLGILAVDMAQEGSYAIRVLAYQHFGQSCAYYPDSDENANDKRNVRDGRYFIWGALHMLTPKDPANSKAKELIHYVSGIVPPPAEEADIFVKWKEAHMVPQCAMRVTRNSDSGPLSVFKPPVSCYCKYDEATGSAANCTKCKTHSDCPTSAPVCSLYGYCEQE